MFNGQNTELSTLYHHFPHRVGFSFGDDMEWTKQQQKQQQQQQYFIQTPYI